MAGVSELGGRPIAVATFAGPEVYGSVSFLPEPGAGVHVFADLLFKTCRNKTLGMHIHDHTSGKHFTGGKNAPHGVWPAGHAGDLHNNIAVTSSGRAMLAFVDSRISVARGKSTCILGHDVVIHSGPDDCGTGGDPCSTQTGCAGKILATASITAWGVRDVCISGRP